MSYTLESSTVVDFPRILCASCDWWVRPTTNANRQAIQHAKANPGHLAVVENSRSRQYMLREVKR